MARGHVNCAYGTPKNQAFENTALCQIVLRSQRVAGYFTLSR
jgi:hypothetical protein